LKLASWTPFIGTTGVAILVGLFAPTDNTAMWVYLAIALVLLSWFQRLLVKRVGVVMDTDAEKTEGG